ncbi:MAG: TRAM domain-containing protein, partial [Chitinophagaceae bacterium]|nr:TRAM domain-containing protein [Chitinophagaceae bacterium]
MQLVPAADIARRQSIGAGGSLPPTFAAFHFIPAKGHMRKKKNQIIRGLELTAYAAEGKSLGRTPEGKVVFVERAVPGDVVDVWLTRNKADWAEGTPVEIVRPSPQRILPFCEHFGVCGGCQWQMLPYEQQLAYKQQQVYDQLTRIGGVPIDHLLPIVGCQHTTHYRNKLEFTF